MASSKTAEAQSLASITPKRGGFLMATARKKDQREPIAKVSGGGGGAASRAAHVRCLNDSSGDEWYTPLPLIRSLGEFDLDPACGPQCKNRTARKRYRTRGLERPWDGRIWLNPPFSDVRPWVEKMRTHGNGVMLIFARTEAIWWQQTLAAAGGVFLLSRRLQFKRPDGSGNHCPIGCALFPFGDRNRDAVRRSGLAGIWVEPR